MTKHARLHVLLPAALALVACTPNIQPMSITDLSVVPDTCQISGAGADKHNAGSLDTNPNVSSGLRYYLGFTVTSNLRKLGEPNNPFGNDVVMQDAVLTYELTGTAAPGLPATETVPFAAVLPSAGELFSGLNIVGPQAAAVLSGLAVPAGTSVILRVGMIVRGTLRAGGLVQSDSITYPIHLYSSSFPGCPAGDFLAADGPCGNNAQDGVGGCCTTNTTVCLR